MSPAYYEGCGVALAAIMLAVDLCDSPGQLEQWWVWPAHTKARGLLGADERDRAQAHYNKKMVALRNIG